MAVKKSIAIIGEGETEWFYFDSLRIARRYPFKVAPDFPRHSDIHHLAKMANDYVQRQYDHVVCLVDMDRMMAHPTEMDTYRRLKRQSSNKVMWIETNPCTEFWFLLHFLPQLSTRQYQTYDDLLPELQRYMPGYEKSVRYFRKTNLYNFLVTHGDIDRAMANSEKLSRMSESSPQDRIAYSQVYKVLQLLATMNTD